LDLQVPIAMCLEFIIFYVQLEPYFICSKQLREKADSYPVDLLPSWVRWQNTVARIIRELNFPY
jgi:hypothetical protein